LNGLPKLKQFLKFEVSEYENIQVEWVSGHTPTAFFRDAEGNTLEEVVLSDLDHGQILDFFVLHGLTAKKPKAGYTNPTITWDFHSHHYEFFPNHGSYEEAKDFALSRTWNDLPGYPVTLTSLEEELILKQHIPTPDATMNGIWLGTQDHEEEGLWKWTVGPEEGTRFWQGKGTQGGPLDNQHHHWRLHEPNNANDAVNEDCAIFLSLSQDETDGSWNDVPCTQRVGLVVEYGDKLLPSTPSSMTPSSIGQTQEPRHDEL